MLHLYNRDYSQDTKQCHHLKKLSAARLQSNSLRCDLCQLPNGSLFLWFCCFIMSFKQNHAIEQNLLKLPSFTQHGTLEIYLCYNLYQQFVLCFAQQYPIVWLYISLFIHSFVEGYLRYVQFQVIMNAAAIYVQVLV